MAYNTPNMALKTFNLLTDLYDHNAVANNNAIIDGHDHTLGKGVQVPTGGLMNGAVTNAKLAALSVTDDKIALATITGDRIAPNTIEGSNIDPTTALTVDSLNVTNDATAKRIISAASGGPAASGLVSKDTGVTESGTTVRNSRLISSGNFGFLQVGNDAGSTWTTILKFRLDTTLASLELGTNVVFDGAMISAAGGNRPVALTDTNVPMFSAGQQSMTFGGNGAGPVTVTTSFPTSCLGVIGQIANSDPNVVAAVGTTVSGVTNSFVMAAHGVPSVGDGVTLGFRYLAWGH